MRGIFFEADTARAVELELRRAGWAAHVEPQRLAGEDDDEDQQWVVVTDAPPVQFEVLVDAHDGWLEEEDGVQVQAEPLRLPDAPKRIKRLDP